MTVTWLTVHSGTRQILVVQVTSLTSIMTVASDLLAIYFKITSDNVTFAHALNCAVADCVCLNTGLHHPRQAALSSVSSCLQELQRMPSVAEM